MDRSIDQPAIQFEQFREFSNPPIRSPDYQITRSQVSSILWPDGCQAGGGATSATVRRSIFRASARAVDALLHRDVGALQLL
ncbi:MAG: hypothetical protein DMF97_05705, partial [Acidobacteria bacterium]